MFGELWFDCCSFSFLYFLFRDALKSTRLLFNSTSSKKKQEFLIMIILITGQLTLGKKIHRIVFQNPCEQKNKTQLSMCFSSILQHILMCGSDGTQTLTMPTLMQKQTIHLCFTRRLYSISTAEYLLHDTGRHIFLPSSSTVMKHGLHLILPIRISNVLLNFTWSIIITIGLSLSPDIAREP